jgi:hypothetical protein
MINLICCFILFVLLVFFLSPFCLFDFLKDKRRVTIPATTLFALFITSGVSLNIGWKLEKDISELLHISQYIDSYSKESLTTKENILFLSILQEDTSSSSFFSYVFKKRQELLKKKSDLCSKMYYKYLQEVLIRVEKDVKEYIISECFSNTDKESNRKERYFLS